MTEPKLRFPEFTGPWEQRKFSELVTIERGGSPRPIDNYITEDENGLNWVKIGDAPAMGNYITSTAQKIKPEGLKKTREVHPGDLILSNSMSFGKPYIMAIDGCIHDGWLLIRDERKSFDLKFLCTLLGTDSMLNQYKAMAAGSTVNNLNKELVGGATVSYPSMDEQVAIREFLSKFDEAITLHQRKLDDTKKLKKALLQKMFPKDSELEPEIRFPDFTGPWEQRKLDDLCSLVTKQTGFDYSSTIKPALVNEHLEETLPFIQNKDFAGNNINMDTDFYIPEEIVKKYPKITLDQPCLLISISGKIGNVGLYKRSERAFIGGAVGICRLMDDTNGEFIMQELLSDKGQHYFQSLIKASSHQNITVEDIRKIEILMPSVPEQEKISAFFEDLDNLITLHQRKLDDLKKLKKSLLQQMFV